MKLQFLFIVFTLGHERVGHNLATKQQQSLSLARAYASFLYMKFVLIAITVTTSLYFPN